MVDISSILKKHRGEQQGGMPAGTSDSAASGPSSPILQALSHGVKSAVPCIPDVAHAFAALTEAAVRLYANADVVAQDAVSAARAAVAGASRLCVDAPQQVVQTSLNDYPNQSPPQYHAVNVAMLAMVLGAGMGLDDKQLQSLGMGALVHDVGMLKHLPLVNKPTVFTKEERDQIIPHPQEGDRALKDAPLNADERAVVLQHHERADGSGYPGGFKREQIHEFALIAAVADVYEAIAHRRPYRDRGTPLTAIKTILNNKTAFDQKLLKVALNTIGIFPVGTPVKLNSKEIAVVVEQNCSSPLCPVVNIMVDAQGKEVDPPRQLNLAEHRGLIYVEDCITV